MRSGRCVHEVREMMADLDLLCPLCNRVPQPQRSVALRGLTWIPACARMTGRVAAFALLYPPYNAGDFPGGFETRLHGSDQGACRGAQPLCVIFSSPKIGSEGAEVLRIRSVEGAYACAIVRPPSQRRTRAAA
jgi:hypothetical protein